MSDEFLEVARQNVAKTVALCGNKTVQFNAFADADPIVVAKDKIAEPGNSREKVAQRKAWAEWLEANGA